MRDITKMDPNKISDSGFYIDVSNSRIFRLTDSEILAARKYFEMQELAIERDVRKYASIKSNKYHKGKIEKRDLKSGMRKVVVIGGAVITLSIFSSILLAGDVKGEYVDLNQLIEPIEIELNETKPEEFVQENTIVLKEEGQQNLTKEDIRRRALVEKYCNIYQVDFDIVYNKLEQLTDNFKSELYLNGIIPNVTCKGQEVCCDNEEELILYFVRCAKQIPSQLGLSEQGLYVEKEYLPEGNYADQIRYYGSLVGIDSALAYSIVQAETSWNSDNFLNLNNPAGLKNDDGTWWVFSTKEEGFIELCLEILKYNRLGAFTIEEIGEIHAPVEDGNEDWLPNVRSTYKQISQSFSTLVNVSDEKKSSK